MAQIGCYVPASTMVLSPVDAIYTRVGKYMSVAVHHKETAGHLRQKGEQGSSD